MSNLSAVANTKSQAILAGSLPTPCLLLHVSFMFELQQICSRLP